MVNKKFANILAIILGIGIMVAWAYFDSENKSLFNINDPLYIWILLSIGIYGTITFILSLLNKKVFLPYKLETITKKENVSAYWWNVVAEGIVGLSALIISIIYLFF